MRREFIVVTRKIEYARRRDNHEALDALMKRKDVLRHKLQDADLRKRRGNR